MALMTWILATLLGKIGHTQPSFLLGKHGAVMGGDLAQGGQRIGASDLEFSSTVKGCVYVAQARLGTQRRRQLSLRGQ
jgi:hypothetical protein